MAKKPRTPLEQLGDFLFGEGSLAGNAQAALEERQDQIKSEEAKGTGRTLKDEVDATGRKRK